MMMDMAPATAHATTSRVSARPHRDSLAHVRDTSFPKPRASMAVESEALVKTLADAYSSISYKVVEAPAGRWPGYARPGPAASS